MEEVKTRSKSLEFKINLNRWVHFHLSNTNISDRFLLNHAQMSVPEQCHTDSKFSVRISIRQFPSCSNVTLLQTGVKPNSGTSDSESCSEENRLLKCSLVQDYTQLNTYCEYESKCSLVRDGQKCMLHINLHPNSVQKQGKLCEIEFISEAKLMHATAR